MQPKQTAATWDSSKAWLPSLGTERKATVLGDGQHLLISSSVLYLGAT